jgi:acetolactate synthase small subunit
MTRTLVALVRDHPSVLNRAVSVIRRRGYNIDRLLVVPSEQAGMNRVTVDVDTDNVSHVVEQLRRLIDVVTVSEMTEPQSYHWQADGADDHVED